ncbi:MAG: DegV family EDD domain-containing protein [Lachnospiraceae bacterium]|nr:DegV family EDD domain-containing protein [Lachnospiraceae bacterium]
MKNFFDYIFRPKKNPRYEALRKYGIQESINTSMIVGPAIILAMCACLLFSFIRPDSYAEEAFIAEYRYSYAAMAIAIAIYMIILLVFKRRFDDNYKKIPALNSITVTLIIAWSIRMIILDNIAYGGVDAMLYMIVSFCIPFCFYLDARIYLLLTGAADLIVLGMYLNEGTDSAASGSNFRDFAIFVAVQLILGCLTSYLKHMMRQQLLEKEEQGEQIKQLNEAQSRFFSNMSHEIRTPINTIIGLNEMILRQNASEEINEDAQNIQAASRMLLHLINDILDMSKFESGQMKLNNAAYHTGDMLSDIVGMLWIKAREKNLAFHVDISPELPSELYGDEVRIKQVLINILNNAIKYTSEGYVRLAIQCERDNEGGALVTYSVSDTGMGIKKESIPHLFTAFKRVDEARNRYIEGTGLGLSIVKNLTDLMGGKISVNSIYTKGSTFMITIPQKIINDEPVGELDMEDHHSRSHAEHEYVESFEAPEAKVLVVDDTVANLMVVEKLLKETKLTVDTSESGPEALKKTLEKHYDVILMDHKMPGMDGVECMHAIRDQAGGYCHDSRIIALTANAGSDNESMYAREGFDGYLMKPVTGEELENTVYRMLPKSLITSTHTAQSLEEESIEWIRDHKKKTAVRISAGSVADIPAVLQSRYGIAVIPHIVRTQDGVFKDGIEIEPNGLLAYMADPTALAKSEPPMPEQLEKFFSAQLDEANNIIYVSLSSGLEEGEYPRISEVAEDFGNVSVVDSGHLSSGLGLMAIEAARLANEGMSYENIISRLERMRGHIHTTFIVDTLDFLVRQKLVSASMGSMADAFMVHPVVALKKGKMKVSKVYFGSREQAWERYIANAFNVPGKIDTRMLFITYVGMTTRELEKVKEMAEKYMSFDEVFIQKASPTIAANCGPGTFGLLFYTEY